MNREELIKQGYLPVWEPPGKMVQAGSFTEEQKKSLEIFTDLAGLLGLGGMTDSKAARDMLAEHCGLVFVGMEPFIPKGVVAAWEWIQNKPWPGDGKPYGGWALVKSAQQQDFVEILDSIHRMVGMVGALAYIERGVDLRDYEAEKTA